MHSISCGRNFYLFFDVLNFSGLISHNKKVK